MNTQGRDIWVFNIIKNKGKINIKELLKAPPFFFFFLRKEKQWLCNGKILWHHHEGLFEKVSSCWLWSLGGVNSKAGHAYLWMAGLRQGGEKSKRQGRDRQVWTLWSMCVQRPECEFLWLRWSMLWQCMKLSERLPPELWQIWCAIYLSLALMHTCSKFKACYGLGKINSHTWISLAAQWIQIHLPVMGTWVQSLAWEDPICHEATKPLCATIIELKLQNLQDTSTKPVCWN